jgi:hypothetical protein
MITPHKNPLDGTPAMGKSYVALSLLELIPPCDKCKKPTKFMIHGEGTNPNQYFCQEHFQEWVDAHRECNVRLTMFAGATIYAGKRTDLPPEEE